MSGFRNSLVLSFALIVGQGIVGCSKNGIGETETPPVSVSSVETDMGVRLKNLDIERSVICIAFIEVAREKYGEDLDGVLFEYDKPLELSYQEIDATGNFFHARLEKLVPQQSEDLIRKKVDEVGAYVEDDKDMQRTMGGLGKCIREYRALLQPVPIV